MPMADIGLSGGSNVGAKLLLAGRLTGWWTPQIVGYVSAVHLALPWVLRRHTKDPSRAALTAQRSLRDWKMRR